MSTLTIRAQDYNRWVGELGYEPTIKEIMEHYGVSKPTAVATRKRAKELLQKRQPTSCPKEVKVEQPEVNINPTPDVKVEPIKTISLDKVLELANQPQAQEKHEKPVQQFPPTEVVLDGLADKTLKILDHPVVQLGVGFIVQKMASKEEKKEEEHVDW